MDAMSSRLAETLSAPVLRLLCGVGLSFAAGQFGIVWLSICGVSIDALVALSLSVSCGIALSPFVNRRLAGSPRVQAIFLTVVLLSITWTLSGVLDGSLTFGVSLASRMSLSGSPAFLLPGLWAIAFFVTLAAWYDRCCNNSVCDNRFKSLYSTVGLAFGCLLLLVHLSSIVPLPATLTIVALLSLVLRLVTGNVVVVSGVTVASEATSWQWQQVVSAFGLSVFLYAATRMNAFLVPMSVPLMLSAVAMSLIWFQLLSMRMMTSLVRKRPMAALVVLLALALPFAFSAIIGINLQWNATISSLMGLMLLRSFQLAVMWCLGITLWRLTRLPVVKSVGSQDAGFAFASWQLPTMLIGFAVAILTAGRGLPITIQLAGGSLLVLTPIIMSTSSKTKRLPLWLSGATAAIAIVFALTATVDSAATAQTLFSARAANGIRLGLNVDLVSQSHCTRLVDELNSSEGQLTIWKTSGDLLELRRDGFPVGQVSSNNITSPQPLAESLTSILPLIMHRNAQSVLLLGDDAGVGMRVCCNFPLHTIEAVRPDAASTAIASQFTWTDLRTSPLEDERVSIRHEPVATAIRTTRDKSNLFDVVVASSPNPMSISCQEQLTHEFYANVKSQLTADGVFCQRISQHDLGAEPLLRILSSLSSLYGRVVVLQMSPGEMAMVAGVHPDSLLDVGLLGRLQRSHVAYELGRSGWDWSQVAALPVIDTNDPLGIFEHQERLASVAASSGYFALGLPLEAARWGNKSAELQQTFRPHQRRMADAAPRSAVYDEYARRFSSVVQQMEIQSTFHDQPWAYRNSLKTEMQRNPRPAIEEIRSGKVSRKGDPRDEYRKDYFVTLGQVLRQASEGVADPVALKTLTQFTGTYEPLLSFFANYELVRIHEATSHPSPARELQHRLHTIYFTDGRDYSIRQITAAIKQIVEDPELLSSDAARFDHTNSLLQELVRRWEGRRGYEPPSARRTQRDVDLCIRTANEAMDAMEDWCDAVDMTRNEFLSRRKFINRALIAPLRDYREQVLAHRIKTESSLADQAFNESDGELPMLIDQDDLMTN